MKYKLKVFSGMICLDTLSATNLISIEATQVDFLSYVFGRTYIITEITVVLCIQK